MGRAIVMENQVSIFSQGKGERDMMKSSIKEEVRFSEQAPLAKMPGKPEIVSTLGHGMTITGNIVCTGAMHVFGRVIGDIHAAQLVICEGAKVEGKLIAPELVVQGEFRGTITGNNVKLQSTAVVDGEIFNKSLTIEQDALFEGVARRIDKPVSAPSAFEPKVEAPMQLTPAQTFEPQSFQGQSFNQPQQAPELKVVT
jgi:cytoskeletal protein CcmA (bactofilin family)